MKFCELLNDIIVKCSCTASDLCSGSDISPSTLRRYRSGERVPSADSKTLAALTAAIASIAEEKNIPGLDEKTVMTQILACDDISFHADRRSSLSFRHPAHSSLCEYQQTKSENQLRCFNDLTFSQRTAPARRTFKICKGCCRYHRTDLGTAGRSCGSGKAFSMQRRNLAERKRSCRENQPLDPLRAGPHRKYDQHFSLQNR